MSLKALREQMSTAIVSKAELAEAEWHFGFVPKAVLAALHDDGLGPARFSRVPG
jgi:hypothetical protein